MKDWKLLARRSPMLVCGLLGLTLARLTAVGIEPPNPETLPSPRFLSPNAGLEFSANPTPQDILHIRVFEELLIPIGGEPSPAENAALAEALRNFDRRSAPDDFTSLTAFVERHPKSTWNTALLTGLGLEYYKSAYYSLALAAWKQALSLKHQPADLKGKLLVDRAICELAGLYSRLGRMDELEALLKSVEGQVFLGAATERVNLAREALWNMKNRPEISFRCGPLALQSIRRFLNSNATLPGELLESASTQKGLSLRQVAELAQKVGLNYRIAFREKGAPIIFPSVVHWRVGHFAAMLRFEGGHYYLEDATFVNSTWATEKAIESEASGYFLIPADRDLPQGWRAVTAEEAGKVWGKGLVSGVDPDNYTPGDLQTGSCIAGSGNGMAIARVHLGIANLQVRDTPIGYTPPVGPPVYFTVRYNQRDYIFTPGNTAILNGFGPNWTHDWTGSINDNTSNPLADVKCYVEGGGVRTFTGFNTNTQTFAPQQFDQTLLKRIGTNVATSTYELLFPDGSKKIYGLRGTNISGVKLTQIVDPAGNAATLTWQNFGILNRLASITDAIGQVTTFSYDHLQPGLITKVTDPFGRIAEFDYSSFEFDHDNNPISVPVVVYYLKKVTDVIGIESRFDYLPGSVIMRHLVTPYGTNTFSVGAGPDAGRWVEITYPDSSRERVEFNQTTSTGVAFSDAIGSVPKGMSTDNRYLVYRNTFHWDRNACAKGYGDYSKARLYHWLHTPNVATMSGILESTKMPLEGRVWYEYDGQSSPLVVGTTDKPRRVGRVLDDGTTQLYTFGYNQLGNVTNMVDPVGRKFSFVYATNGIDLLELRQTRGTNNQLIASITYNNQHRPLTITDAAGQTTTNTFNARGQLLTTTNPRGESRTYTYNANGYLLSVDGPLAGPSDLSTFGYDAFGRHRAWTNARSYTLVYDYDDMDRPTKITHPDGTFRQFTYDRLDLTAIQDGAGRQTLFEYDSMRQLTKRTDPLGRVTHFDWCSCGGLGSLIDPMGRKTEWYSDVQGRPVRKQFSDGGRVDYFYENTTSRLRQIVDENRQVTQLTYNRDNTIYSVTYTNSPIPTPSVIYRYDADFNRLISMTDGTGTSLFSYFPITQPPALGAGHLSSVDGPLDSDTINYSYDELGRRITTSLNGSSTSISYDAAGRVVSTTNLLGEFTYAYDSASHRPVSVSFPNGQTEERSYGDALQERRLQRITHRVGSTPVSEFLYSHNIPAGRIATWSQQTEAQSPDLHTFGYDSVNQLLSATITNGGTLLNTHAYTYDFSGNRLTEQTGTSNYAATYNTLNQISTSTRHAGLRTNEWDSENRLMAITSGNERTEFTYDGFSRLAGIRQLVNGSEVAMRRFVRNGSGITEERNATNGLTKRYFPQGMKLESGPSPGNYFFTRDHLGSIREVMDNSGNLRARYSYDPHGRRSKISGDVDADFGFANMFWSPEVNLSLTHFRAYDPELGRWLSRDPLKDAELMAGQNLYAYVENNPVNLIDPLGLQAGEIVEVIAGELRDLTDEEWWEYIAERGQIRDLNGGDLWDELHRQKMSDLLDRNIEKRIKRGAGFIEEPARPRRPSPKPTRAFPGLLPVVTVFIESGLTILTMTDCDTVNGILGLVRQGKGGSVNAYQDEMLKELGDY
jgi:RHS repeat-associated protein